MTKSRGVGRGGHNKADIGKAEQLEADSQMLEDLIEMICNIHITRPIKHNDQWSLAIYETPASLFKGSTPREAIAAAIKEWKK
jgi:hypothetical protein